MNDVEAQEALDKVIRISRAEMYKPIQVAEVLYRFRKGDISNLLDLASYRVKSKSWRDEVTQEIMGKRSISTAKFQDDIWSETAVPPSAMSVLGELNSTTGEIEKYIYLSVRDRYALVIDGLNRTLHANSRREIESLLESFSNDSLTSSGDRFFEILCQSIIKTELVFNKVQVHVTRIGQSIIPLSVIKSPVEQALSAAMDATAERLGHTNAADAGLDIWTNFGVIANIKRRVLDKKLLVEILSDTPVGNLLVICESIKSEAMSFLANSPANRSISVVSTRELMAALDSFEANADAWTYFIETLVAGFKREFPLSENLQTFLLRRGYV